MLKLDPKPARYTFSFPSHSLAHTRLSPNSLREPRLVLPTIVSGLTCYFDRSLGANLLYRFERPQYAAIRKEYITGGHVVLGSEKEMSQVYGAEHLLRMLGGCALSSRQPLNDFRPTSVSSTNDCFLGP